VLFANAPTDFWGIVVPGWIGAIGGLVGAVVAVVSLLIAMRSREAAAAAQAAEAQTRGVVADTIAELDRANDEQLDASRAASTGLRATDQEEITLERHARQAARYDALLRRLRPLDKKGPS
jgi:hypothetical protein